MRTLLSLIILGLSFSAGTAHAYLSPGEVFPDLKVQEEIAEAPTQAPAAFYAEEGTVKQSAPEADDTIKYLIAVAAVIAVGGMFLVMRKPKIPTPTVV